MLPRHVVCKRWVNGICLSVSAFILLAAPTAMGQRTTKKPDSSKDADTSKSATAVKPATPKLDDLLKGLKYREIGPFRGCRSLTASGIPCDPNVYYFRSTRSRVWKSTAGDLTWQAGLDDHRTSAI